MGNVRGRELTKFLVVAALNQKGTVVGTGNGFLTRLAAALRADIAPERGTITLRTAAGAKRASLGHLF